MSTPFVQLATPHTVPAGASMHAPVPDAHALAAQMPTEGHVPAQQNPPRQLPLAHWLLDAHASPAGSTQVPDWHVYPLAHPVLPGPVHEVAQTVPLQGYPPHETGEDVLAHVPEPVQNVAAVELPLVQLADPHWTVCAGYTQAPVPVAHAVAPQVPPVTQGPVQQTPPRQAPLRQSPLPVHGPPTALAATHCPPTHAWSASHVLPHDPQFPRSVWVFTHAPPQMSGSADGHAVPHVPLLQVAAPPAGPAGQTCPHAPQFDVSLVRLTQLPEQFVSPAGHSITHTPAEQGSPAGQAWPHAPQFCGSVPTFVHPDAHGVFGERHSQRDFGLLLE